MVEGMELKPSRRYKNLFSLLSSRLGNVRKKSGVLLVDARAGLIFLPSNVFALSIATTTIMLIDCELPHVEHRLFLSRLAQVPINRTFRGGTELAIVEALRA